jgi:VCBS repeat-containing protein
MDTTLLSIAQQFSGLPIDALIAGPLNAAANANATMALTQTKFLLDTCFKKTTVARKDRVAGIAADPAHGTHEVIATPEIPEHDEYAPIMIVMSLSRPVIIPGTPGTPAAGTSPAVPPTPPVFKNVTTQFNLPLLTIVPINSLAVKTVDVSFEMEVKSSSSETETQEKTTALKAEASLDTKLGYGPFSVSIKGSVSYDSKDSQTHNTHYEKSNSAKYSINVHAEQLPVPKGVNTIIEAFTQAIQPITLPQA